MSRNYCTFSASFTDDSVENEDGDVVVPPGRTLAGALSGLLTAGDGPYQLDHYGWEFRFRSDPDHWARIVLQGHGNHATESDQSWLIIVFVSHGFFDLGRTRRKSREQAIRLVDSALAGMSVVDEVRWYTRQEYEGSLH